MERGVRLLWWINLLDYTRFVEVDTEGVVWLSRERPYFTDWMTERL
jgi:hypothetical protein